MKNFDTFLYIYINKVIKRICKTFIRNGFIGKFENFTFNLNFVMIYIIHKMLL